MQTELISILGFFFLFYVIDTSPFLVKDEDAEKQYNFDLQR